MRLIRVIEEKFKVILSQVSTYIVILIMNGRYGKYHDENAVWKHNVKDPYQRHRNSITQRNR